MAAERLGHRIISVRTLGPQLKVALGAAYAILLTIAILIVFHGLLETPEKLGTEALLGLRVPKGVVLAAAPMLVLALSFALSGAILANSVTRYGAILFLMFWAFFFGSRAVGPWLDPLSAQDPAHAYLQLRELALMELPILLLVGIILFRRRLPQWAIPAGSLVALGSLALLASWFSVAYAPNVGVSILTATLLVVAFLFMYPALLVVGVDITEWTELLGDVGSELLSQKLGSLLISAFATLASAGIAAYGLSKFPLESGALALRALVLLGGLILVVFLLVVRPSPAEHAEHHGELGYLSILGLSVFLVFAPMVIEAYGVTDAPPPAYRLARGGSIIVPAGWKPEVRQESIASTIVRVLGPPEIKGFILFIHHHRDVRPTLNDLIPGGESFPRTELAFQLPDERDWARFETTLVHEEKQSEIDFLVWRHELHIRGGSNEWYAHTYLYTVAACNAKTRDTCRPAVEAMQQSFSFARKVPTVLGRMTGWFWPAIATACCILLAWRRRTGNGQLLLAFAIVALVQSAQGPGVLATMWDIKI